MPSELCIFLHEQGRYCGSYVMDIFRNHFKVCRCKYRICSDRTWGKYEYEP